MGEKDGGSVTAEGVISASVENTDGGGEGWRGREGGRVGGSTTVTATFRPQLSVILQKPWERLSEGSSGGSGLRAKSLPRGVSLHE